MNKKLYDPMHLTIVMTGIGFAVGLLSAIAVLANPYRSGGPMMALYMFLLSPIIYTLIGFIGGYTYVTFVNLAKKQHTKTEDTFKSSGMVTELRR